MPPTTYLRSRKLRGRWFHYYRRAGKEKSLGVHGLNPTDARVQAAYWAEHARWQDRPAEVETPKAHSFAWGLDMYLASRHWTQELSDGTRTARRRILEKYRASQGDRPLTSITREDLEAALYARGGFGALNHLKALRPMFAHMKGLRVIPVDPTAGLEYSKPKEGHFPTASAADLARFIKRWPVGTVERLAFDLALYTGAARHDLARLSRRNISDDVLTYHRQKTGVEAYVPMTVELRAVIARTPDISPAFILNGRGKPYTPESLGNLFGDAAREAGVQFRIHGLRKAFCVYWAEQGRSTHEIAAMAGHTSLSEVERYTKAADRKRIVGLIGGKR